MIVIETAMKTAWPDTFDSVLDPFDVSPAANAHNPLRERTDAMKKLIIAALLVALALPVVALGDGAAIYKTKCNACHGPDGSGQTPVGKSLKLGDLRSPEVQKMTDAE